MKLAPDNPTWNILFKSCEPPSSEPFRSIYYEMIETGNDLKSMVKEIRPDLKSHFYISLEPIRPALNFTLILFKKRLSNLWYLSSLVLIQDIMGRYAVGVRGKILREFAEQKPTIKKLKFKDGSFL